MCEENLAAEHPGVAGLAPVLQCFAWMACYRPTPVQGRPSWGFARTGSFEVPPRVVALGAAPPFLVGDNTDWVGVLDALAPALARRGGAPPEVAVVVGTGYTYRPLKATLLP